MSWKSFACLAAIAALAAPAAAQAPTIGLEDRGGNTAALTITTGVAGSLGTDLMVSFSGGISLVDASSALSMIGTDAMDSTIILDTDGIGIQDNPFFMGTTTGLEEVGGEVFASVGLGDQGVRTFDLLTFEFADFGTITASGFVSQGGVRNSVTDAVLDIVGGGLLGDANGDGMVDFGDINPFVQALTDPTGFAAAFPSVNPVPDLDTNMDMAFDFGDINGFVGILTSSSAVAVPEPGSAFGIVAIGLVGILRRR